MLAMSTFVSPQIFLVSLLAGWLNQERQKILEYLRRCCTALAESEIRLWWWPRYVRA